MKRKILANTGGYGGFAFSQEESARTENIQDELVIRLVLKILKNTNDLSTICGGSDHGN